MNYKNYNNGSNFLILGLLMMLFFGGFKILFITISIFSVLIFRFLPLILIGYLIYNVFKRTQYRSRMGDFVNTNPLAKRQFLELLVRILVHAMKSDGKVEQSELNVVYGFFQQNLGYNMMQMQWVRDLVDHALKSNESLEGIISEINHTQNKDVKLIILQLVYRVVYADHVLSKHEKDFITTLVEKLQISYSDHEKIRLMFESQVQQEDHYAILGVRKGADKDEIKSAYRKACKTYHPDKVFHLGEEFKKVAEEKMQKINLSYTTLMKQFS